MNLAHAEAIAAYRYDKDNSPDIQKMVSSIYKDYPGLDARMWKHLVWRLQARANPPSQI